MSKAFPESYILKPRDSSLDGDSDSWPQFVVTNAHVHLPEQPDAITSLLEASAGYPLTVVGQLEPLDAEDGHLYNNPPSKKRVNVVIEEVRTYAYGQYADHSIGFWAAGKAGWFEIKPGRGYKDTFREMGDAVNVLYFIADSTRNQRKSGKGKGAASKTDLAVQGLFEKYAAEELGSSDSAPEAAEKIYEHKEFLIMSMLSGRESLDWSKNPIFGHLCAEFPDLVKQLRRRIEAPDSKKAQTAKPKHKRQTSVETGSDISVAKRKPWRPAKKDTNSIHSGSDTGSLARESAAQAATGRLPGRWGATATAKTKSRRIRQNSVAEPATEEYNEEPAATPGHGDGSDEELGSQARKDISSLRPRASKGTKSAGRRGGKGPAGRDYEDAEDEAMSPTGGKRKYREHGDSRRPSKRLDSRSDVDEGIDIPTSPSDAGDDFSTSELPLRSLAHVPDQVQEDTWVCALDGCTHKVYGASKPESQKLIRDHYTLHAYDDDERVKMVKKLQAPSLPVGHLMERVKLHAKVEGFHGSQQMASRYPMTVPGVMQKY